MSLEHRSKAVAYLNELIKKYQVIQDGISRNEEAQDLKAQRSRAETAINSAYQDYVWKVLSNRIAKDHNPEENPEFDLYFTEDERETLAGYFEATDRTRAVVKDKFLSETKDATTGVNVLEFHELLTELYRDAIKLDEFRKLCANIENMEKSRELLRARIDGIMGQREKIAPLLVAKELVGEFLRIQQQIDSARKVSKQQEFVRSKTGLHSKKAIMDLVAINDKVTALKAQIRKLFVPGGSEPFEKGKRLYDHIERELESSLTKIEQFGFDIEKAKASKDELWRKLSDAPIEEIVLQVKVELSYVFDFSNYAAKMAKTRQLFVFWRTEEIATRERIKVLASRIEEFHPGLFDNMRVKRVGLPTIALIPGCGVAISDYDNNRILVPFSYPNTLLESLASAVITYLKDVQSRAFDPQDKLLHTYKTEISRETALKSFQKVHRALQKDYCKWIERGAEGMGVFEKETREWFERYIAPDKYGFKSPLELRGKNLKELRDVQTQIKSGAGTNQCEDTYALALVQALSDKYEPAIEMLQEVIALDIDNRYPDAYYNIAIAYRKMQNFDKARENFEAYVRAAGESWWTRKAQEHLRELAAR
ncbi:MAG: tetratricopeptide repeat protein [Planctomycetes bacterium]|nr:tetratricopeptide repeat protein [Planctomycetota bacterium]